MTAATAVLVIVWLVCGYFVAGVAKHADVERWRRFNPRILEHGEVLREPSEYDRAYVWIGWLWMLIGLLGLFGVFVGLYVDREKRGFLWWNPFPWFSKK